jgi:hypothetical protein
LQAEIERLFDQKPAVYEAAHFELFAEFKSALNSGKIRAAEPLSQEGNREQRNGNGPGVVQRLSLLGRKKLIGLEKDQVIQERVQDAEQT